MEITSLNASTAENSITVNGTTVDGILAVQLVIYDETGTNIIKMYSTDVSSDNTFSVTIPVSTTGTFVVTAADYDGGEVATTTVSESAVGAPATGYHTVKTEEVAPETNASSSPALYISLATGIIVATALVFGIHRVFAKRTK